MQEEKNNIKSVSNKEYSNPFNLLEIIDAVKNSNNTATGPDEIHYQMLKHLPYNALYIYLMIFGQLTYFQRAGVWLELFQYPNQEKNTQN